MTVNRKRFVIVLRCIVVTLLVFALAGVQAVKVHRRVCTIFVIDAPVAEVLPVDLDVRRRRVYPAATVVIIMHTSGSMAMALILFLVGVSARRLSFGVPEVATALARRGVEVWRRLKLRQPASRH